MKRNDWSAVITTAQVILDAITIVASFLLGYFVYHQLYSVFDIGVGVQPFKIYRNLAFGAGVLFLIIFERFGLYSRSFGIMNVEEIKRILQSLLIGSLILFSASFLLRPMIEFPSDKEIIFDQTMRTNHLIEQGTLLYSRLILLYSLVTLLILITVQRSIVNKILLRIQVEGPGMVRVLIYGANEIGRQLQRRLFENPRIGLKPVGFLDDNLDTVGLEITGIPGNRETTLKVLGSGLELAETVQAWAIHEVIIVQPNASTSRIYEIINSCAAAHVRFSFVPNLYDLLIQQVKFEEIEGIPLLRMRGARHSYIYLIMKRSFDVAFSLISLIVSLPLWPLIALAIRLESKGPVFYDQERVGKDGKRFVIYKFRSMYRDVCGDQISPKDGSDPRITRVGAWLRRYSIDEIPQLFNVLRGDMSIVGPRPEMPFVVENYTAMQKQRLRVRPGITGIWQISAARNTEIHENLDYDFYYVENQSFLLDVVIIAKTIMSAFSGKGM